MNSSGKGSGGETNDQKQGVKHRFSAAGSCTESVLMGHLRGAALRDAGLSSPPIMTVWGQLQVSDHRQENALKFCKSSVLVKFRLSEDILK